MINENILAFFGIDDAIFWTYIALMAATAAISFAISQLTQKDPKPPSVKPDDFSMPTQREGTKYTIGFGTNWIENPLIDWWGDISTSAIVRHYTVNKWFNNKRVYYTIGYHYAVGMNLILCQGVYDGVKQIKVGDTVAWPDSSDHTVLNADSAASAVIDEPNLFGGEDKEGGIVGTVTFNYGGSAQARNAYLVTQLGADVSAYRGLTSATLQQVRLGTSPYLKPWKFLVKRTDLLTDGSAQWYIAKAGISNSLNVIHIIRECLTNQDWGLKISTALLPAATWEAAADTIYTEGFGLCMKWESQTQTLRQFIQDVLRHIDAKIYEEPTTGEVIIKLIRDDYTAGDLTVYDDSDIVDMTGYGQGTFHETINAIQLTYWNMLHNKPISIPNHDIALMDMQNGKWVEYEVEYLGVVNDTLASKLVARERQQVGSFAVMMRLKCKRTMSALRPGDTFKVTWAILGITEMIMRVLKINLGTLQDGQLTIDCVQDVFSVGTAIYTTPADSGWTDPRNEPAVCPDRMLMEATFWDVLLDAGLSEAQALDDDSGFLVVAAKRPSGDAYDYHLYLRDSLTGGLNSDGRGHFTPNGTLDAELLLNAANATITMTDEQGLADVAAGDWAIIEDEIVKVLTVTAASNQVSIARGCLDTVPAAHAASTRVWFIGTVSYIAGREFTVADQPGVKILPRTGLGELAIGDATVRNASVFASRMIRPYPPGNLKVNSSSYPVSFSGQPTLTWTHRDRLQQLSEITEHSAVSIGPEAGTTYTLKIYDENNDLVRTETALSGVTYTYSEADELSDCGLPSAGELNTQLRFVLYSVRDGYDSWQSYDITVARV